MMDFDTDSLNKMAEEISGFTDDLSEAIAVDSCVRKRYKHVLICGMGASAIGGAIFADSMYYSSKISVDVAKTMYLPEWVDKDTLFVACSYSGETYETIFMYKLALDAGLDVVAVTHGGTLKELSEQNGNPMILIEGRSMQPRSAIGWFIGTLATIIEDAGGPGLRHQIKSMLPRLRGYRKEMEAEDGIAWRIAKDLEGHVPVVYGAPDMEAIAVRMKNQLNENSKIIAFSGVVPEFNHNEVVGWYDDPYRTKFMPVVICDDRLVEISKILKATLDLLESRDVPVSVIDTKGESLLERMIYGIMVGDHISLYIAALHGIDPCNVDPIVDIKTRMKTVLNR
ncbi:Glucose-6-phosphate isomerase, archaeal II Mannose-6-phosphate isomerase, archaeal [Candidatus Methanomethylophilus alvi Mx1201]|uniref:Glucose-6-phosphate isomerase, archaeal II Mannose-6-phosphate isomerase, archaeal n=14 Tax=Methanomethylophilus alvi TaxID=1291540 RepID=M9SI90_METAX|nr:bifunctional phosphoglucose/phosphomannose isomerase [Methanomethylophilus alvi]AGI85272.1 Glucose-6-phosphate isomerase, archaeal II Mannose-6-phosphate isomerase, archaeal [Candidatus Methanomethylophilus alvi Mx1201]AYQ54694.1 bifunctional phosphoglucose/phosphomannose isomerase [Methanomethylophilus alvi]